MPINITIRQLEGFRAVAEAQSFSAASREIHLSQPALSLSIRNLEDAIGIQLFDRDTRNVRLTTEGKELFTAVSVLLRDFASTFDNVKEYIARQKRRVTVATSPSLGGGFLSHVIANLRAADHQIEVHIIDTLGGRSTELVSNGVADFAITTNQVLRPDLIYRELFADDLVVLCRTDHPIAKRRIVGWSEIAKYEQIALPSASAVRRQTEEMFLQVGRVLRPVYEVGHAGTIIGLILAGLGVSILPLMFTRVIGHTHITWKLINSPSVRRSVGIVTSKYRSLSLPAQDVIDACVALAAQEYSY